MAGTEQRCLERVKAGIKLSLGRGMDEGPVIDRPALSRDISQSGLACTTQQRVNVGDRVQVSLSTQGCPEVMGLPERLRGYAKIIRIERKNSSTRLVALHFEEAFAKSMEYGFFMAWLLGRDHSPDFA